MKAVLLEIVYIFTFERDGCEYIAIDTAGVRRRGKTLETIESFSVLKTLEAISDANVVILMIDARIGLVEQDLHLLGHVLREGRGIVLAINKWDGMSIEMKEDVRNRLTDVLALLSTQRFILFLLFMVRVLEAYMHP